MAKPLNGQREWHRFSCPLVRQSSRIAELPYSPGTEEAEAGRAVLQPFHVEMKNPASFVGRFLAACYRQYRFLGVILTQ
jgi:hypothetical protein